MHPRPRFLCLVALLATGCFLDAASELGSGGSPSDGGAGPGPGGGPTGGAGATSSGGAPQGGGGEGGTLAEGGGGSTSSGEGGATCGNEDIEVGEACDDGSDTDPFDGCNECDHGPRVTCSTSNALTLPGGKALRVVGTTVGAGDEIHLNNVIPNVGCPSDGPDAWVAVEIEDAGTVTITLQVAPEGDWGGSNEKGVLVVRDGCVFDDPAELFVCRETTTAPGQTTTQMVVTAGQVLVIGIDGKGNADQGPFELSIAHNTCGDNVVQPPEQCDSTTADCAGCLLVGGADPCGVNDVDTDSFFVPTTSHCYVYEHSGNNTFYEAREKCIELGGDLASLTPAAEKTAFDTLRKLDVSSWVGLEDFGHDDTFNWLAGGTFDAAWDTGNPNNGESEPICGALINAGDVIANVARDATCDSDAPGFVCELPGVDVP